MKANAKALLGISVALALVAGPLPAGFGPTPEKGDTPPTIVAVSYTHLTLPTTERV